MVEIIGVLATILAVLGVMLNNRQRSACFKLWIVSNSLSLIIHVATGVWTLAVRDAIFVLFAFEGDRLWKNKKKTTNWEIMSGATYPLGRPIPPPMVDRLKV
jgi:nicotinamide riboside transporter PnuC